MPNTFEDYLNWCSTEQCSPTDVNSLSNYLSVANSQEGGNKE